MLPEEDYSIEAKASAFDEDFDKHFGLELKNIGINSTSQPRESLKNYILRDYSGLTLRRRAYTQCQSSPIPRPSLTAFFAAVENPHFFYHGCKKSCEGRPGYEANSGTKQPLQQAAGRYQERMLCGTHELLEILTIRLVGLCEGGGMAVLSEVPEADSSIAAAEGHQVGLVRVPVNALDRQVLVGAGEKMGDLVS